MFCFYPARLTEDKNKYSQFLLILTLIKIYLGGRAQELQVQITRLEQENRKLNTEKDQIMLEKDRLSHDIQTLNHRVTVLMRQFSNQQVLYDTHIIFAMNSVCLNILNKLI